jgi:hypothetical protein
LTAYDRGKAAVTCKRFLKSRAAIFFISEEFLENFQMLSLLNVGTWQYLKETVS